MKKFEKTLEELDRRCKELQKRQEEIIIAKRDLRRRSSRHSAERPILFEVHFLSQTSDCVSVCATGCKITNAFLNAEKLWRKNNTKRKALDRKLHLHGSAHVFVLTPEFRIPLEPVDALVVAKEQSPHNLFRLESFVIDRRYWEDIMVLPRSQGLPREFTR
jgi:hypothetical protein